MQKTSKTSGARAAKTKTAKTPSKTVASKGTAKASAKARGFAYAPMPEDYPGNTIWWTLRFVGTAPDPSRIHGWERSGMSCGARGSHEWVDVAALEIGDRALGGTIVAMVDVGGQPAFKVQLASGTRIVPRSTLENEKVERQPPDKAGGRDLQVELDADPDDFDASKAEAFFASVHEKFPLVAVLFQEGQFVDGEPLLALDDATLAARLTTKK